MMHLLTIHDEDTPLSQRLKRGAEQLAGMIQAGEADDVPEDTRLLLMNLSLFLWGAWQDAAQLECGSPRQRRSELARWFRV